MTQSSPWWQDTTIYQIYPRSFFDSNHDGIGDLVGIISKLDHIQDLGFETIWISPFYSSPQQDFGYDVSDYQNIAPEYGTLADACVLISEVHKRGMRIIFDMVLNHTSIRHPWFLESSSSRENPKRGWYIWRDGRGNRPPNNWKSMVGGSGWHHSPITDQYYFASFLPFQPDLNWRNPDVRDAMFEILKFWLDKGVDGYRLDIFHTIFKEESLGGDPFSIHFLPNDNQMGFFQKWENTIHQPEVFSLAKDLHILMENYPNNPVTIGEVFGSKNIIKKYIGENLDGLDLVFIWDLLKVKGEASFFRNILQSYEDSFPPPYSPVYVFGNHDVRRVMSRIKEQVDIAKLMVLFQFTVRGIPVTYYGEEIGMLDGQFPAKTAPDPDGQKYKHFPEFFLQILDVYVNRDGCRTPMQWTDESNAGFCTEDSTPWLPVKGSCKSNNVRSQQGDEISILNTYKKLLALRKETPVLKNGNLKLLDEPGIHNDLLVYGRYSEGGNALVVINFGRFGVRFYNPTACDKILLAVGMGEPNSAKEIEIKPKSGIVLGD